MNQSNQSKRAYWDEQLTLWKTSGLSGERYCKEHRLSYASFCYYRNRYHAPLKKEISNKNPSNGFVELAMPFHSVSEFQLVLPNGVKVIVPQNFQLIDLKRLMEGLRSC